MQTFRVLLILLLTAVVLAGICVPTLLTQTVPAAAEWVRLDEFPLLNTCGTIARKLVDAIGGHQAIHLDIVTKSIGAGFWDELVSLVVIGVLTIPVSLLLGLMLYKPLYNGLLTRGLLYISLNLCSVMIAWILYRQVYFRYLIEGVIQKLISNQTMQTIANYATQLATSLLVGAVAIKIALAVVAAHLAVSKVILPLIGTLIRTLLFAFLVSQILLLSANPAQWQILVPMMLVTLVVSGLSDGFFGS